jgi:hypothetical protein
MSELNELTRVMDSVCKDKGIKKGEIVSAVEEAVLSAAQKLFRMRDLEKELEVHFNEDDGDVLFQLRFSVKCFSFSLDSYGFTLDDIIEK